MRAKFSQFFLNLLVFLGSGYCLYLSMVYSLYGIEPVGWQLFLVIISGMIMMMHFFNTLFNINSNYE